VRRAGSARISEISDALRKDAIGISRSGSALSPIRQRRSRPTIRVIANHYTEVVMNTLLDQAGETAKSELKRMRWALGLNGALAVAFGLAIIIWPNISLYALVLVFGAFSLARGVIGLGAAITTRIRNGRGWLILSSLASIVVGVVVFFWTDMSALALLYVIGAYAIVLGVVAFAGAFRLPLDGTDRAVLALGGVVSVVFGIVMFAKPGAGALVLLALIAAYALVIGIAELTVAIGGKRLLERQLRRSVASAPQPKPQTAP
jgi:uncharacterized membrane protein HdeD (DUF308 family)